MPAISATEQLLIELVNRARLDPLAEAARLGIGLNDNLTPGSLTGTAKQVLAGNALLNAAADGHSRWILQDNTFSHTGEGDSTATQRMVAAGYTLSGLWRTAENIAWRGTTGTVEAEAMIRSHHDGLFRSSGHRVNLLTEEFREIGVGQAFGPYTHGNGITYNSSMLTEKFAKSGSRVFLTGVAYDDADRDGFYSIGEGRGGVGFAIAGAQAQTAAAGGYDIALATPGRVEVTVTRGATVLNARIDLSEGNAKLDLVNGVLLQASADVQLLAGGRNLRLLGNADLAGDGNAGGNVLIGNGGDNLLRGFGGNDSLHGGAGNDSLEGGLGNDLLSGGTGDDLLRGGAGNDSLLGGPGNDRAEGGEGADTLRGDAGADTLLGGPGNDLIFGGDGHDRLLGGRGDDRLFGGPGNDVLIGEAGNDRLHGGPGNDVLFGGPGADVFLFAPGSGTDRIRDFSAAEGDRLLLDPGLWPGTLTPQGVVDAYAGVQGADLWLRFGPDALVVEGMGAAISGFAAYLDFG